MQSQRHFVDEIPFKAGHFAAIIFHRTTVINPQSRGADTQLTVARRLYEYHFNQ